MNTNISKLINVIFSPFSKQIINLRYQKWTHKKIDWKKPKDIQQYIFTEYFKKARDNKLQQLADLTDKIKVRNYVKERIGEQHLTNLYGVWDNVNDIDFSKLPDKFVLKTNNGCGTNIIIRNKTSELEINKIKHQLKNWLNYPYASLSGQPHYSLIEPKILAEEFLIQNGEKDMLPYDYKFFCFNGEPQFILYYEGRKLNGHITPNMVFDLDWNPLKEKVNHPTNHDVPRPISLKEMIEISRKLSKGHDFVRIDLYEINGKPVFGEMTFTPDMVTNFTKDFLDINNFQNLIK